MRFVLLSEADVGLSRGVRRRKEKLPDGDLKRAAAGTFNATASS